MLTIIGCSTGGNGSSTGNQTVDENRDSHNSGPALSGSVNLTWVAPQANADGSTLFDLGGFRIYYGKNSNGYYDYSLDVGNATSAAIHDLSSGTWCFALTAYDMAGNESDYSPGVCKNVEAQ